MIKTAVLQLDLSSWLLPLHCVLQPLTSSSINYKSWEKSRGSLHTTGSPSELSSYNSHHWLPQHAAPCQRRPSDSKIEPSAWHGGGRAILAAFFFFCLACKCASTQWSSKLRYGEGPQSVHGIPVFSSLTRFLAYCPLEHLTEQYNSGFKNIENTKSASAQITLLSQVSIQNNEAGMQLEMLAYIIRGRLFMAFSQSLKKKEKKALLGLY